MLKKTALSLAATALMLVACSDGNDGPGVTFYVTDGTAIYTSSTNDTLNAHKRMLTGLTANTELYAIDVNPRTAGAGDNVNGIGSDGQVYSINPATGVATPKGAPDTTVSLVNKAVEMDYNPRAGVGMANEGQVFRVTSSTGDNYRRNDSNGAPATQAAGKDSAFVYKTDDRNAGKSVVVSGIAYTNSQPNAAVPMTTTVYAIDSLNNSLAILGGNPGNATNGDPGNPNAGMLTTVGPLTLDIGTFVGFDIASVGTSGVDATSNVGYVTAFKNGSYNLYTVNLANGELTFATGLNPMISPVRSFAVKQ